MALASARRSRRARRAALFHRQRADLDDVLAKPCGRSAPVLDETRIPHRADVLVGPRLLLGRRWMVAGRTALLGPDRDIVAQRAHIGGARPRISSGHDK